MQRFIRSGSFVQAPMPPGSGGGRSCAIHEQLEANGFGVRRLYLNRLPLLVPIGKRSFEQVMGISLHIILAQIRSHRQCDLKGVVALLRKSLTKVDCAARA
jgi:hypothetical protein